MIFPPKPSKECVKVSHVIFDCRVINHHPSRMDRTRAVEEAEPGWNGGTVVCSGCFSGPSAAVGGGAVQTWKCMEELSYSNRRIVRNKIFFNSR